MSEGKKDSVVDDQPEVRLFPTFDDMPLHQSLLRGIFSHGFEKPSAIQQRAIVPFIRGDDLIVQAQPGSGKTGVFSIGLLQRMDPHHRTCQALVLLPTRELAQQTYEVIAAIGEYLSDAPFCHAFVGGTRVQEDLAKLKAGVVVAVGTPGRVYDVIKRGALRTDALKVLVLDEAGEMLSQSFSDQIYEIFRYLPKELQVALFSATMPPEVLELVKKCMRNPTQILVKQDTPLEGIKQYYVAVEEEHKMDTLLDLYESVIMSQCVIFTNIRRKVEWITERMHKENHIVSFMHADMLKDEREKTMSTFKSGASRVLITTDGMIANGIDVQHVSIVINFDLPTNRDNYLHRLRCFLGPFRHKGVVVNMVSARHIEILKDLESHYRTQIEELPMDFAACLGV